MRILLRSLAVALSLSVAPYSYGQIPVGSSDLEGALIRGPGPGAAFNEGMPYTQRYAMGLEPAQIYSASAGSRRLRELDYADRFERAVRFGYPLPNEPAPYAPPPRTRFGFGLGIFRW